MQPFINTGIVNSRKLFYGFIIKFTDNDPDVELKRYGCLVHAQGYSAAVVINETDGKVRFPLIKMEKSEPE